MESREAARAYVERRFPNASPEERRRTVEDWLSKPAQAKGIADDFERRAGSLAGLHVLDVGSGNGDISIAFAERDATVEGVDIEEELISIARAAASAAGSTAQFRYYAGEVLPFPDHSFDAVVSVSVIEHVDAPLVYLSEILRVLKPSGVFYLAFPNRLNPKETHTGLWGLSYLPRPLAQKYLKLTHSRPLEDHGLHFYTYWDVLRLLRRASANGRRWRLREERGRSTAFHKRLLKGVLRAFGIPHQALLPHVMVLVEPVTDAHVSAP